MTLPEDTAREPSLPQLKRLEALSTARFHVGAALVALAGFGYHEADAALDAAESAALTALHALLDEPLKEKPR